LAAPAVLLGLAEALGEADGAQLGDSDGLGGVADGLTHTDSGDFDHEAAGAGDVLGVTVASELGRGGVCGQLGPGVGTGGTNGEPLGDGRPGMLRVEAAGSGRSRAGAGGCSTRVVGAGLCVEWPPDGTGRRVLSSASSASTPPEMA
jgi:hypothetical protein